MWRECVVIKVEAIHGGRKRGGCVRFIDNLLTVTEPCAGTL